MDNKIRLIVSESLSPYFNLAAEEYFLQNTEQNIIMLWRNDNTIVVGRFQNTLAEINLEYVETNGVRVVRRLTGGGAVFHDLGNLNFTFIQNKTTTDNEIDFSKFLKPILEALHFLDVPASFSGRNDMVIEGKKISGNAMAYFKNRVLEHGTLLFSSKQQDIASALKVDPIKFSDKAVKSVRKRVTNIAEYLKNPMDISEFTAFLANFMLKKNENVLLQPLSEAEKSSIEKLSETKYKTWEWNYGISPQYAINQKIKTKGGIVQVVADVKGGIITDVRFYGDFFSTESPEILAGAIVGTEHTKNSLRKVLENYDVNKYLSNTSSEEIVSLFF